MAAECHFVRFCSARSSVRERAGITWVPLAHEALACRSARSRRFTVGEPSVSRLESLFQPPTNHGRNQRPFPHLHRSTK
jgi:hypothetical protein